MRNLLFGIICLSAFVNLTQGQTNISVSLPPKEKTKIYLLMGQSNMAGIATPEAEDKKTHPHVFVFTLDEKWQLAKDPLHSRKAGKGGVGPGFPFAKTMAQKNPETYIGLVPCAVGGTPWKRWDRGGDLYARALKRAQLALAQGTLAGVLWHQGEADSKQEADAKTYADRLSTMIRHLREDLHAPQLPVVVGQIGEFTYTHSTNRYPFARIVNAAIANIPKNVPHTGCALSHGLTHRGDQVHFDTKSQRELGARYATEMEHLQSATVKN